jgi:translation elongation factor P/translation initiation factor 5A
MAINKKLIHFKTKQNFDNEVAKGSILDTSIVFVKDAQEIYTHGTEYQFVN